MATINDTRNKNKSSVGARPPVLDKSSDSRVGIGYGHHEVHEGLHFETTQVWQDVDLAFPSVGMVFYMPDTVNALVHLQFTVHATGLALVELIEDAEVVTVANGSPAIPFDETVYNNRRVSANTADMQVGHGAFLEDGDLSVVGTTIWKDLVGGSGSPSSGTEPGGSNRDREFILKQYTPDDPSNHQSCYVLRVTTLGDDNNIAVSLDWYEHEDKS